MTPREVLLKAAALVERGHSKGASARDANGNLTDSTASDAVCWCSLGGLYAAASTDAKKLDLYEAATMALAKIVVADVEGHGTNGVIRWNDAPGRTQAEVVAALKAAAEACG